MFIERNFSIKRYIKIFHYMLQCFSLEKTKKKLSYSFFTKIFNYFLLVILKLNKFKLLNYSVSAYDSSYLLYGFEF